MTNEQLINQAGHRLGQLTNQPGYAHEIEKLIQLAKNEAYREAAQVCGAAGDNDNGWGCEAAITALIKEI